MKTAKTEGEKIAIKQEQKRNFIIIYDSVYKNNDLSITDIGLLVKLLASAPTFKPTHRKLQTILHTTDYVLRDAEKSLKEKGYLKIKKNGNTSEWIVSQEPTKVNNFDKETLIDALIHYKINLIDLKIYHKLKYIDDNLYIQVRKDYGEWLIKTAKYDCYNDD